MNNHYNLKGIVMKTYRYAVILIIGFIFSSISFAESAPFNVNIGTQKINRSVYRTVNITSTVDNVMINQVDVNRGQCRASISNPSRSYTLPFGKTQSYLFMIYNSMNGSNYHCDIIEIKVKTSQGEWTFKP